MLFSFFITVSKESSCLGEKVSKIMFTGEFMHSFRVSNLENLRMAPVYSCCLGELWVFVSYRLWVQRFVCVPREMPFVFSFVFQGRGG